MFQSRGEELKWLQSLKVGDTVCMRYGWDSISVVSVTKITATQIQVGSVKYNLKTGREIGNHSRFHFNSIEPVTDANKEEILEKQLRRRASNVQWSKLPVDILKQVLALVPQEEKS